jgi:hypothetical protein
VILPVVGELPAIMPAIGEVATIVTIVPTRLVAFVMLPRGVVSVLTRCSSTVMAITVAVAVFGE